MPTHDDELAFLRGVEQDVQWVRRYTYGDAGDATVATNLLTSLKVKLNDRIIELLERRQLSCNQMGGGSAGLDTADDFARHCDKHDGHDGPHSYEDEKQPQPRTKRWAEHRHCSCEACDSQLPGGPGGGRW